MRSEHLLLALLAADEGRGAWRVSLLRVKPDDAWKAALDALEVAPELRPERPEPAEPRRRWVDVADLRAVVPVAQSQTRGPHMLLLLCMEPYADGFILRSRFSTTERPPQLPQDPYERPDALMAMTHPHFAWEAHDDLDRKYAPDDSGGSRGGSTWGTGWRTEYAQGFMPALAADATMLHLRVPELRWSSWPFAVRHPDEVIARIDPLNWAFQIPLEPARWHIQHESPQAQEDQRS